MEIKFIVAQSKNRVIGNNNTIPWYVPEDLKRFRDLTLHSIVVMGRKTFESLPNGPLKNRINIVITNNPKDVLYENKNKNETKVIYTNMMNIFSVINYYINDYNNANNANKNKNVFIIGGAEIYRLFFIYCKTIYMTLIDEEIEGDILFPIKNEQLESNFNCISKSDMLYSSNKNIKYQYLTYERKK